VPAAAGQTAIPHKEWCGPLQAQKAEIRRFAQSASFSQATLLSASLLLLLGFRLWPLPFPSLSVSAAISTSGVVLTGSLVFWKDR